MAIKKPLVIGSGEELIDQLQPEDTLSTADMTDSTDKRFVTDAEKAAIGSGSGGGISASLAAGLAIVLGG